MAEKRYAVVTGGNKGIGFEICKQLASQGVMVVLTARDDKNGIEALEKLKNFGLSENIVFHQLDVVDPKSISILVDFIKSYSGKLDILVNNAGTVGAMTEGDFTVVQNAIERLLELATESKQKEKEKEIEKKGDGKIIETHELAEACMQTNYYGTKRVTEAFIPLLQLSPSPTIVNVSSTLGKIKLISNEWAKKVLSDVENLTEEKVEDVVKEFLKDIKEGKSKGWATELAAYIVSKSAVNAFTRILANKYKNFRINCLCPGYAVTDITGQTGYITAAEGAENVVKLALLSHTNKNGDDAPSGLFFIEKEVTDFY